MEYPQRLGDLTRAQLINGRSLDAARLASAKHFAPKNGLSVAAYFREQFPRSLSLAAIEKASVSAASPSTWGGALAAADPDDLIGALIAFAEPFAIAPRLGLRRVPFSTPVLLDTTDDAGVTYWRGPGATKVAIAGTLDRTTLAPLVVAAITLATEETLRFSRPAALEFLRDLLARLLVRAVDVALFDPTSGPASESQPASLTFGVGATVSSGQPRADLDALLVDYVTNGGHVGSAVLAMSSENAAAWRLIDPTVFTGLTIRGGDAAGIPVVAGDSIGDVVALVDRVRVAYADDGAGRITTHSEGTIQAVDTSVSPPAEAQHTSLWQTNTVAVLAERSVNWIALGGGIAFLQRSYLSAGSPS